MGKNEGLMDGLKVGKERAKRGEEGDREGEEWNEISMQVEEGRVLRMEEEYKGRTNGWNGKGTGERGKSE